jgi:hypothetical protein
MKCIIIIVNKAKSFKQSNPAIHRSVVRIPVKATLFFCGSYRRNTQKNSFSIPKTITIFWHANYLHLTQDIKRITNQLLKSSMVNLWINWCIWLMFVVMATSHTECKLPSDIRISHVVDSCIQTMIFVPNCLTVECNTSQNSTKIRTWCEIQISIVLPF